MAARCTIMGALKIFGTSPQNFPMLPWEYCLCLSATKSEDVGLIVCAISFPDFRRMWSQSTSQTDDTRWQDRVLHYSASRGKNCSLNTTFCVNGNWCEHIELDWGNLWLLLSRPHRVALPPDPLIDGPLLEISNNDKPTTKAVIVKMANSPETVQTTSHLVDS